MKNKGTDNPVVANLRNPKIKKSIPKALNENNAKTVIECIYEIRKEEWQAARDIALLTLIYGCGLRISEAMNLKRKEAPLKSDSIIIKGKGNKERLVPILPIIQERLKEYLKLCPHGFMPDDPLFVGARGGKYSPVLLVKYLYKPANQSLNRTVLPRRLF